MVTLLKDVIVSCNRNVHRLGLRDLNTKARELGMKTITVCFLTLF